MEGRYAGSDFESLAEMAKGLGFSVQTLREMLL